MLKETKAAHEKYIQGLREKIGRETGKNAGRALCREGEKGKGGAVFAGTGPGADVDVHGDSHLLRSAALG